MGPFDDSPQRPQAPAPGDLSGSRHRRSAAACGRFDHRCEPTVRYPIGVACRWGNRTVASMAPTIEDVFRPGSVRG